MPVVLIVVGALLACYCGSLWAERCSKARQTRMTAAVPWWVHAAYAIGLVAGLLAFLGGLLIIGAGSWDDVSWVVLLGVLSVLLSLAGGVVAVGCVIMLARFAAILCRREPRRKELASGWWPVVRSGAVLTVVLVAAVGAVWVGWVGANALSARTTLFEIDATGSEGLTPGVGLAPVHTFDILVEHPGIEHSLLVNPEYGAGLFGPDYAVELWFSLAGPDGQLLVDEQVQHEVTTCRTGRSRSKTCWRHWDGTFTPTQTGVHRLTLTVVTVEIAYVHIRIKDPEKTDGERAPRY